MRSRTVPRGRRERQVHGSQPASTSAFFDTYTKRFGVTTDRMTANSDPDPTIERIWRKAPARVDSGSFCTSASGWRLLFAHDARCAHWPASCGDDLVRRLGRRSRRRFAAAARQPALGLPSRSSFNRRPARLRVAKQRYGAASFACIHERTMVDQNSASWNLMFRWLRNVDALRTAA